MKKPTKTEAFHKNLALAKSERNIPAVGVDAILAVDEIQAEKCIARIETDFRELGRIIHKIQSEKRFSDRTFELYIKRKFGKTRQWAYQLIEAYKVTLELPQNVKPVLQNSDDNKELSVSETLNARQTRALGKAPKEKRHEVLEKAVASGGKLTAKKIQESYTGYSDSRTTKEIEADFKEVIKDANGEEVPENITEEFQRAERESKKYISMSQELKNFLEKDDLVTVEVRGIRETSKDLLAGLKVRFSKHVLCPKCEGKKCAVCSKRGFVSNHFATKGMGK